MKGKGDKDSEDTENAGWATDKMWKWERGCSKEFLVVWIKREMGSGTSILNLKWNCSDGVSAIS